MERIDGSKFFFLISGWTIACLKGTGTRPELRDILKSEVRLGPMEQKTSLRRRGGDAVCGTVCRPEMRDYVREGGEGYLCEMVEGGRAR